ncbi:MAG: response regulator [Candidatus Celaenobacter antarcticus]|nr:response regulator [Candidatus Celaenobacter antarcticus]
MAENKKILIIDDEPDARAFSEAMLTELGDFEIETAKNGLEGLQKAELIKPDLIILDVQMPVMNGFQVFKELRRKGITENIPVIMLTGIATTTGLRYDAKDMGITLGSEPNAFIDKPVEPDEFHKTVSQILGL